MCSVVGYIGKGNCRSFVIDGLTRLEYRGYDAAGFACLNPQDNRVLYAKSGGKLENLISMLEQNPIDGFLGIGHTRWSTHGVSSTENAHPHFDCQKTISVVHNGIIENHTELRKKLLSTQHTFCSQTDTEIVPHLLESLIPVHETMLGAVITLVNQLEGAYAIIAMSQHYPDQMLLIRKRSPLCIGIGDSEMFIASDPVAFAGKTKKVVFLPDLSFAFVKKDQIELFDFDGNPLIAQVQELNLAPASFEKQGHAHFMLKEIYEQRGAIGDTVRFLQSLQSTIWDNCGLTADAVKKLGKINLIGCGSSWHAARIGQFFFEKVAMTATSVHLASEFRYMPVFPDRNSVYVGLSQSGETADTLEAIRLIKSIKLPAIALTNSYASTLVRETDGFLLTQAGREVAVASTKAFTTQVAVLYWFAHRIALEKGLISQKQMDQAEQDLLVAAEVLESCIDQYKFSIIDESAPRYAQYRNAVFLGRHISYPFAMEAALKLKEIAYIFSQSYPAGELKHGPLALIDENISVYVFSCQDELIYQKLLSNVEEAKARKGHIVSFAFEGQDELKRISDFHFEIPRVNPLLGPLAMSGLMQFFVYAVAKQLGCAIDKPRNLAKSVTVE